MKKKQTKETQINEQVIYQCKTHWIALIWPVIISLFFFLGFITMVTDKEMRSDSWVALLFIILILGIPYIKLKSNQLVLTTKRIYGKTGIIKTHSLSSPISKIQTVNIETSFLGKILGYSDLTIHCITGIYHFKKQMNAIEMQNAIINTIK